MTHLKTFEHKGRSLKLAAYDAPVKPAKKTSARRAPGRFASDFEISQLAFADDMLTAQVSGKHIAYLFAEILMKDGDKFYGPVLRKYIPATRDNETGGLLRPDWDDPISISIPLRPSLTLLTDGVDSAFAFTIPEGYCIPGCHLDGLLRITTAESQSRARIVFDGDGNVKEILAREAKQQRMISTPRPVKPKHGDTFSPFVQVLTEEDGAWKTETVLSTALTFGDQPLRLEKESLMAGEYLVGILVQDLDGGFTRKYLSVTI